VDPARAAEGVPIPRMVMSSGTGKRLGEVANGVPLPDGTVSVCVRRGLLQQVLREEVLRRGIPVTFGARLESYEITSGGVTARFADGTRASGDILVGADGIHATSPSAGQGASMTCEDAVVLAKCLRDLPDPARAFAAYEGLRRERVERVVAYSRRLSDAKAAGPVARVVRDLVMPLALRLFATTRPTHGCTRTTSSGTRRSSGAGSTTP